MTGGVNMYFPYLRGRQFELIALREMLEKNLIGEQVIPVIEPIKPSSTLRLTLRKFVDKEKRIAIVRNPQVGGFLDDYKELDSTNELVTLMENDWIIQTHILNKNSEKEVRKLEEDGFILENLTVINTEADYLPTYHLLFNGSAPQYILISDNTTIRRSILSNRVLFENRFSSEDRNSDYKNRDILFSEDHLFFADESYKGFSDYSIVGKEFNESGFAPYAVAIHIVYFDEHEKLRVKSYVSDSNNDIRDPANKYYEALGYLVNCPTIKSLHTVGLAEFRKHYQEGTYPGLGTVKKLSIMHHIEMMSRYLDRKQEI